MAIECVYGTWNLTVLEETETISSMFPLINLFHTLVNIVGSIGLYPAVTIQMMNMG